MPVPPWLYSAPDQEIYSVKVDAAAYDKTSVYITDARRVGVMLRDGRLTLRNHSAITEFVVQASSEGDITLHATTVGDNGYVRVGDKGAFFANASHDKAQKFSLVPTGLGIELHLADERPAVFDDFYDVSIGKWQTGRSSIALLVHRDVNTIWPNPNTPSNPLPGRGGGAPSYPLPGRGWGGW